MSKRSFFILIVAFTSILWCCVYAIQDTIQQVIIEDISWNKISYSTFYPCFSWDIQNDIQLPVWSTGILITEVWFDGSDEWIEITNITSQDVVDTFVISWVKSKPIVLTWLIIPAYTSFVIADSASSITGVVNVISWQWLSISDTTWFTIVVSDQHWVIYDAISFDKNIIESVQNNYSLDMILANSGDQLYMSWYVPYNNSQNLLSGYFWTPWVIYCGDSSTWTNNSQSGDILDDNTQENLDVTGANIDQDIFDENGEDTYFSWSSTESSTGNALNPPNTWNNTPIDSLANHELSWWDSCVVSEIHPVADILPEYIEIYCSMSLSGEVAIAGLGTATSIKKFHLQLTTGQHLIVTSSLLWFIYTWNILLLPWISLLDGGEQITIQRPHQFSTWDIYTGYIIYPALQKWESYYPTCTMSWTTCLPKNIPTPWYSQYYTDIYYPYLPTKTVYQTVSSSTTTSLNSSSSTYYQDLYKKRKETAQTHEKTIAELQKSLKNSTIWTWNTTKSSIDNTKNTQKNTTSKSSATSTTTNKTSSKSTSTSLKVNQPKSTTSKSTNTTSKTTSKTTPKATPKSTSTTKSTSTSTKTTTPKPKTISTTSKAYILLTNEHKLYKSYVDFIHKYLKSHLYTQYDSLQLSVVQSLLKKSLQTAKQNRTILSYSWWQEISIFDFSTQRQKTTSSNKNSLDIFAKNTYPLFNKFVQSKQKISKIPILTLYTQYFIWRKLLVDI